MQILTDLHCHTIASTHAYSTVKECAEFASEKGLQAIAITDHAPALPDGAHLYHFQNLPSIPRRINGVVILRGAECSLINEQGELDLDDNELKKLDIVISSIHTPVYLPKTFEEQTNAWLNVIEQPYLDILGHIGRVKIGLDASKIVKKAKEYGKLIEINSHTFDFGGKSYDNCKEIALACKKYDVPIVVNSDAHICYSVGDTEASMELLNSINFDENLIINTSLDKLLDYFSNKKNIII